jgi:glycosyltransferase involved in cell wall biosynthesis
MVERVIFPFRGAELGGSHLATFTLATAIQRRSQTECVVLCAEDTLIMAEAKRLGLSTLASGEAPTGRNNAITDFTRLRHRRSLLKAAARGRRSVVHTNDVNSLRAWGLPARLSGMGVVYHHHALNRMWWPPHLVSLSYANAIVCVSDSTIAAMRGWRRDARKELNPFEIDRSVDRHTSRKALLQEFGWPNDTRIVGWIGNFWERKRPGFFIDTAVALARMDPRCRFVMFGRDGDHTKHEVQQLAEERGIGHLLTVPGFRQPVEANLAALDLLLAPAPREPFGRALVEAMLLGTPIVATRGAGHSEIIGAWGGGVLADERAMPEAVARLCSDVLASPDAWTISAARAAQIAEDLSADSYAGRFLALYDEAISGRSGAKALIDVPPRPSSPA